MRRALEDPLPLETRMSHAYILGACEWIITAGGHLYLQIVIGETKIRAGDLAQGQFIQGGMPRERWDFWKKRLKVLWRELGSGQGWLQDRLFKAGLHMNWLHGQYMAWEIEEKCRELEIFLTSIKEEQTGVDKWLDGV
jgi:hypothetical protein